MQVFDARPFQQDGQFNANRPRSHNGNFGQ